MFFFLLWYDVSSKSSFTCTLSVCKHRRYVLCEQNMHSHIHKRSSVLTLAHFQHFDINTIPSPALYTLVNVYVDLVVFTRIAGTS